MNLTDATWTDVDGADPTLSLLPVGATEQHGPHAPLGTDHLNAEAVARAGAQTHETETGRPVAVAPTIPVGISEEHRQFPGTLWVSPDTFRSYVRETVESLLYHGIDRVVIVNGHGGNVDALREVSAELTREGNAVVVPFTWFEHVPDDAPAMGHGGPRETALLRYAHPHLVREDRIDEARDGGSDRWGEWVEGINLAYDSASFTDNGVAVADRGQQRGQGVGRRRRRVAAHVGGRRPGRAAGRDPRPRREPAERPRGPGGLTAGRPADDAVRRHRGRPRRPSRRRSPRSKPVRQAGRPWSPRAGCRTRKTQTARRPRSGPSGDRTGG